MGIQIPTRERRGGGRKKTYGEQDPLFVHRGKSVITAGAKNCGGECSLNFVAVGKSKVRDRDLLNTYI